MTPSIILPESHINKTSEFGDIFLLSARSLGFIFLLGISFIIAAAIAKIGIRRTKVGIGKHIPITTFVNLLIQPLEASPTVKVIPEIIKSLHLFLGRINVAETRDRLDLGEPRVELEHWREFFKEVKVLVLVQTSVSNTPKGGEEIFPKLVKSVPW